MYTRLLKAPDYKSFFLFGPRGTGKTTWVKKSYPAAVYLDLLESELFNSLLANPQRLENYIPKDFSDFVIIDEIQKVPKLLNEVHRLIENNRTKFILTGSSPRKLRKKGENLLGGRALTHYMYPLTAVELGEDFDLAKSVNFGQLPSAYLDVDPKKYLEGYVKTYLEEEISQEGLTRNLSAFARFLETASFSQGSVLNTSEVSRDATIERKVTESYFKILEDLLVGYRVPVFSKKAKRRLVSHPKFYFFDAGVYKAVRPMGPLDEPEVAQGVAFESLFFQDLLATNQSLDLGYKIYYYRTSMGQEVDFVLYGEKGIKAFEVKRTANPDSSDIKSLRLFLEEYPEAKGTLIYGGNRRMHIENIDIIPMEEALKTLPDLLA
ncbi:ATPase [candidate division WWE3 bacterium CG08_land_8_20_14_0_20_41_10]|uniref:ATPase n=1 Tax=candidate division WWE3 bacterium CG08_land_8_20_14_0_20_41_10 TaxID=1975085 RepID=A0A2H0XDS9_UNCKA|nr:MAG: ATPase [candidate division WWE3 bacterium CG08_land_8_20_14_0_20_41_10]